MPIFLLVSIFLKRIFLRQKYGHETPLLKILPELFIHSFPKYLFIEHTLCVTHSVGSWDFSSEKNTPKSCTCGADILVGKTNNTQTSQYIVCQMLISAMGKKKTSEKDVE